MNQLSYISNLDHIHGTVNVRERIANIRSSTSKLNNRYALPRAASTDFPIFVHL